MAQPTGAGWAKLAARTGPHGAIKHSFAGSAARIVITARVSSLPPNPQGMKVDVIRPDGRNARTEWLHAVSRGETVRITLTHSIFADHPGKWRARFVIHRSVRSAITFSVRAPKRHAPKALSSRGGCDPSYPTVCIPPAPPDLDCGDVPYTNFTVRPPDPHNFDGNHNGVGCES